MRKPHRRMHLLVWALLAPATLGFAVYALSLAPQARTSALPPFIEGTR
ncbi:MAG: hypothetical protein ACFB6R_15825 [Alphaproteobacteria bacterium]